MSWSSTARPATPSRWSVGRPSGRRPCSGSAGTCRRGRTGGWWSRVANPARPRIYPQLMRAQIRAQASYRTSFVLDLVGNALAPMIELLVLFSFFRITRSIGGFTAYQVLAMYGVSGVAFSLADLAVGNIERIRQYVRTGMFDAVPVRSLS